MRHVLLFDAGTCKLNRYALHSSYQPLDEPDIDHVQSIEIDSSDTVINLRTKIASNHHLLVPGQIVKLEKVFLSMDDEEINDKLRIFTFTPTANIWRATTKLSAVIALADLAPDHLHLIIRPTFINVNYVFPSISPEVSRVRIAYSEDVKALLHAILADIESRGYSVSKKDYVVLKASIDIDGHLHCVLPLPKVKSLRCRRNCSRCLIRFQATNTSMLLSSPGSLILLHPIFAKFVDDCEHSQPSRQINQFTLKFAESMSQFYADEKARAKELKLHFSDIGIDLQTIRITGTGYEMDAALIKGLLVCGEIKNSAANNVDPFLQAILYYLEQTREVAAPFPSSILPSMILICAGLCLFFAGAVWNGCPNVQVLTPAIPFHFHSTDLKLRTMTARYISAFASAIQSLETHYDEPLYQTSTVDVVSIPSVREIFPYPTSFTSETSGLSTDFIYHSLVKSGKLTFRGEISDTHEKICIKFVQRYSTEVHRFCASINCAPELLAFEPLDGGWSMVIMEDLNDYFDLFRSSLAPDRVDAVKERLKEKLIQMHQRGFVHGDVRNVNVMVTNGPTVEVVLVDFDWAGKIGEARYPMNIN